MIELVDFFEVHWRGFLTLALVATFVVSMIRYLLWMFGCGRFSVVTDREQQQTLRFVFADLLVKIINDFRHLLALIVVLIFALALGYALAVSVHQSDPIDAMSKSMQAVVSSMGSLIGAIIGYYFGEKAGEKAATPPGPPTPSEVEVDDSIREPEVEGGKV